ALPTRSGHRMSVPWARRPSRRRRSTLPLFAVAPLVLLAAGLPPALAVLPAVYPLFILIRRGVRRLRSGVTRTGIAGEHGIRLLLAVLPLGVAWALGTPGPSGWVAVSLFGLLPLAELVVVRGAPGRKLRVSNLPGVAGTRRPRSRVTLVLVVDLSVPALAIVLLLVRLPAGALMVLPVLALLLAGYSALDSYRRIRESVDSDNNLYGAVEAYDPKF